LKRGRTRAAAKPLMPALLANSSLADLEALLLPIIGGSENTTPTKIKASNAAMIQSEP
jgi:hypothetical protein